jgi:hypothetical protein
VSSHALHPLTYAGLDHDGVTNKPTTEGPIDEVYYSGPDVGLQVRVPLAGGDSLLLPQIPWAPIMVRRQAKQRADFKSYHKVRQLDRAPIWRACRLLLLGMTTCSDTHCMMMRLFVCFPQPRSACLSVVCLPGGTDLVRQVLPLLLHGKLLCHT